MSVYASPGNTVEVMIYGNNTNPSDTLDGNSTYFMGKVDVSVSSEILSAGTGAGTSSIATIAISNGTYHMGNVYAGYQTGSTTASSTGGTIIF
jgi:hypothetical protein